MKKKNSLLISVIIRTLNEEKYLEELLNAVRRQKLEEFAFEIVIVDSGSTDKTLEIANKYKCRITHIKQSDFTFGRSLNDGCEFAKGEIANKASYVYGKQVARDTTKFSEKQIFSKFYPTKSLIPQDGYFCNNANAALKRSDVGKRPFNENLTGLEDMFLAQKLVKKGKQIAYVANAPVYHIHNETWRQVRIRYEREAIALHEIMPNIHFYSIDFIVYTWNSIILDFSKAFKNRVLIKNIIEIIFFRTMQYWGTYKGNKNQRKLSLDMKIKYFYPTNKRSIK